MERSGITLAVVWRTEVRGTRRRRAVKCDLHIFELVLGWFEGLFLGATESKTKAEIQALSSYGFQYLSEVYLPIKLQEGDWI